MALEVDGGLVLSALLLIVIVSFLTYLFSHHPKHFTHMPPEAVGGKAQDNHVVNQDKLDPNLLEKSKIIDAEEKETTNQYVKLLKKLEIRLLAINQLIDDAETTYNHQKMKQWIDELKEVVYDAEDVRDVIATQTHEYDVSTTPWNPFDRSLQEELEDVLYRMQCLLEQKDVFGLKPSTRSNSTSETLRPPTSSLVDQSGVYGRDVDKDEIKKLLLSNDGSNGDVIAIVGMGGIGKTTLARYVFNDYQINGVFKLNKVWICVSEDFDVIKITKTILQKLTSHTDVPDDFDQLQMKLKETLSGKKFLLVLDDVWNENYTNWDILQRPFKSCAIGSKIMVTTRDEIVASAMRATSRYKLKRLSDEYCWLIFAKHAFKNVESSAYSTFEELGRKLVKKCGGLPLAVEVVGGLVGTRLGHEQWNEVLKSDIWDLSNEASDNVLPVLRLSYHYLPSYLKRCFAFCSIVPKDFEFEREKLVLLWMAENLLQDSKRKKRIDVGYEYLRDLESRSLIQPASIRGELYFSMHDLVNDLAKSIISGSGEFYRSSDLRNSFNAKEKTRHFSCVVTRDDYNDPIRFKKISGAKRLRTFLPLLQEWIRLPPLLHLEIWPQLNVLRSLTLAKGGIITLSDSIGNLKLLRYLDLSYNDKLNQLPKSLASLYNLEVLNLNVCVSLTNLPESLASLYNLSMLNLTSCSSLTKLPESLASLYSLEMLNLSGCSSLTKLPSKMRQLIRLNYLNIRYTSLEEMPLQMGRLKDLDVLTDFVVGKGSGSSIAELKELKHLQGKLYIRGLHNITHLVDASIANLEGKSNLEELSLKWDIDHDNSEDATIILKNLRPHVNLKKLFIFNYSGIRLSDWSGHYYSFINLVDVAVFGFKHCLDLSPLGQLPSLKTLFISRCDSLVTLLDTDIPVELPKEIHHHIGHFSALVKLDIFYCPKLKFPQHHRFTSIEDFTLDGGSCASLRFFLLCLFPKLKRLCLKYIPSMESLAVTDEAKNITLEYLEAINIWHCSNFEYFNAEKWCAPKMTDLTLLNCGSLKVLPENMCNVFPTLLRLELIRCPSLEVLPQSGLPSSLKTLEITGCSKLSENRSSLGLQRLLSQSHFEIVAFESSNLKFSLPIEGMPPGSVEITMSKRTGRRLLKQRSHTQHTGLPLGEN